VSLLLKDLLVIAEILFGLNGIADAFTYQTLQIDLTGPEILDSLVLVSNTEFVCQILGNALSAASECSRYGNYIIFHMIASDLCIL